jgi:hypothetical protein
MESDHCDFSLLPLLLLGDGDQSFGAQHTWERNEWGYGPGVAALRRFGAVLQADLEKNGEDQ